jgi:hypothetical protein
MRELEHTITYSCLDLANQLRKCLGRERASRKLVHHPRDLLVHVDERVGLVLTHASVQLEPMGTKTSLGQTCKLDTALANSRTYAMCLFSRPSRPAAV